LAVANESGAADTPRTTLPFWRVRYIGFPRALICSQLRCWYVMARTPARTLPGTPDVLREAGARPPCLTPSAILFGMVARRSCRILLSFATPINLGRRFSIGHSSQFLGWSPASLTTWSVFPFILLHQLYGATGRRALQPVVGLVARQFNDLVGLSFPLNSRKHCQTARTNLSPKQKLVQFKPKK